jgi:hypothetical protein
MRFWCERTILWLYTGCFKFMCLCLNWKKISMVVKFKLETCFWTRSLNSYGHKLMNAALYSSTQLVTSGCLLLRTEADFSRFWIVIHIVTLHTHCLVLFIYLTLFCLNDKYDDRYHYCIFDFPSDCIMKFACCVAILHQAILIQTCLQEMYIPMGSRKK